MNEWIGWLVSHPLLRERLILSNSSRMRKGADVPFLFSAEQS